MLNKIWTMMILSGIVTAAFTGRMEAVTGAAFAAAREGIQLSLQLMAMLALWSGLMKNAERAGLIEHTGRVMRPLLAPLFPGVPAGHPAFGAIVANMSANLLGLGNAATPLGIQAMDRLQQLNPSPKRASADMCTLLALNTSSVTLIPSMVIFLRSSFNSLQPEMIIVPTILATGVSTAAALMFDRLFRILSG